VIHAKLDGIRTVVALSGPAAEQRLMQYPAARRKKLWRAAATWARRLANSRRHGGDASLAWKHARALINANWRAVERVADHLHDHGKISEAAIDRALGRP
jgi:hypothetical protein